MLAPATREVTTATARTAAPQRRAGWVSWELAADAGAILALLALLVFTAGDDGGRSFTTLTPATIAAAVGALPLLPRLRQLGRPTAALVVGVAAGPVATWMVAPYRAGGARPILVGVATSLAFLAARHLWDRPWGPTALATIVGAAIARAWYGAFLAWWGAGMGGGEPQWLALSWHNQSGTLMAAAAVACLAIVQSERRAPRVAALLLGPAAAAGCWLSGSRGAVLAGLTGGIVVLLASRSAGWRKVTARTSVLALASVLLVVALSALAPSSDAPIASREQTAEANLIARFGHAEAALKMGLTRPVVGSGPGSYRWASLEVYPRDTNLTSSAHNEYAEAFGETGLVGGLPVALAALAAAGLMCVRMRRRQPPDPPAGTLRATTSAAAAGLVATLGLHAGADFDWEYVLLPALLAVGVGVLAGSRGGQPTEGRRPTEVLGTATAAVLTLTFVGSVGMASFMGVSQTSGGDVPWRYDHTAIARAISDDDLDAAEDGLDRLQRWNPGAAATPVLRAALELRAGTGEPARLVAAVDPQRQPGVVAGFAVDELVAAGALAEADAVLDAHDDFIDARRAWGVTETAGEIGYRRLAVAAATDGCPAVAEVRPSVERRVATFGEPAVAYFRRASTDLCPAR